MFFSTNLACGQ